MAGHTIQSLSKPGQSGALVLKDRSKLLEHLKLKAKTVVEVGSLYGNFAAEILAHNPMELFLVDPWLQQSQLDYLDISNAPQATFEDVYQHCVNRFEAQIKTGQLKMLRMLSHQGARLIGRDNIDLVYIDGNHSYNWVLADLFLWYPRIKPGGWLAGHDYLNSDFLGVEQAVSQFCAMTKLKVDIETNESDWTSFAIQIRD
jgi:hypothetical protein